MFSLKEKGSEEVMKKRQLAERALIAPLCFSLLISGSACNKKSKETALKKEVLASDPYFNSEVYDLEIPLDETKELNNMEIYSVDYLGDQVSVQYELAFVTPDDYDPFRQSAEYNRTGKAVFDLKGNMISNEQSELGGMQASSYRTHDKNGNSVCISQKMGEDNKFVSEIVFSNKNGDEVKRIPVDAPGDLKHAYFKKVQVLEDDRMIITEGSGVPHVFDGNGKYLFSISAKDASPDSDVFFSEGKYYVITTSTDMNGIIKLSEIDMTSGAIKPGKELKNFITDSRMMVAGEDGIYSSTPTGIFRLNISTCEMEEVLNWNQTDLDRSILDMIRCYPKNSDEIIAISQGNAATIQYQKIHVVHLHRAPENPHAGKKILNIGGFFIPRKLYDYCTQYNADPSRKARIVFTDYSEQIDQTNAMESFAEIENKLLLDLLSGTGPDILINYASSSDFARDDVLVDLNTFIDGANGLDRTEYFDNIFRATEVDGKLYAAPIAFQLLGLMENTDVLDTDRNWTLDDLDQAVSSISGNAEIFPDSDYDTLLFSFMGPDRSRFMDKEKKETHFCCDSMKRILQEAKKYGKEKPSDTPDMDSRMVIVDSGYYDIAGYSPEGVGQEVLFHEGRYAMLPKTVRDPAEYAYLQGLAGNKGRLIGYPSPDGEGITAYISFSMAIVKSSSYQEEAWDIIRGFYSDDAQTLIGTYVSNFEGADFPVGRSAFEKTSKDVFEKVDKAYKKWAKDSKDPKNAIDYVYFPLKDGIYEDLLETVESVRCTYHVTTSLDSVLSEEAAGYFAGSRSEEDVLKNIDNRAKQILQEK